jgi:hypothetical protein
VSFTAVEGHQHCDFTTLKQFANPVTFRRKIHTTFRYRLLFMAAMTSARARLLPARPFTSKRLPFISLYDTKKCSICATRSWLRSFN